ncbi:DUF5602 domain-containing protein [Pseudonocardia halophobica]|uniref:TTHB210-like domain-containing protein n=1 Tax=Pseudonocardia halophobica TaxID=29401 RepID=A0A9W6NZP0_9PSEU|nr:DUF5602 domain-containing protein [Pseudonocardia halophobica]GLL15147.1 hypothetical protein GCM10017577_62960 [Pseudonocardia halophobica]
MDGRRFLRRMGLVAAACTAAAVLSGCGGGTAQAGSGGTFFGPSQPLGNGTAKTYAVLDGSGNPTEIGLRLSPGALDGLPTTTTPAGTLMLDLPDQASATAFDHVMLNWNPQGHDPVPLFGKPHFDFHFDMVDMATIEGIQPTAPDYAAAADRLPEARYVPQGYAVPPGGTAAQQAVPGMGVHLVDSTDSSLVPGSYDFTQIIINGTWDGRYTFVEPMVTRDWLLTKPTLEQPLKLPEAYQKNGYYPTDYVVRVDDRTGDHVVALTGMTMRQAS